MLHTLLLLTLATTAAPDRYAELGDTYAEAVLELNVQHARKPGTESEAELSGQLPRKASAALAKLLNQKPNAGLDDALERCARAALDLDRVQDFDAVRARLVELKSPRAEELGVALSLERVLLLGEGGLDVDYLKAFAPIIEDVLAAYDEVFGFQEFSKVPGKKLRLRLHLEEQITRPPHFAPQFPHHSEIDFPVINAESFTSPTDKGQFLLYGLCHELGHVIAMWGAPKSEEDHHAWAHFTGLIILEHLSEAKRKPKWIKQCRDHQWRNIAGERERLGDTQPGTDDRDQVLALLFGLHDLLGPGAIGDAFNTMDAEDKRLRVNHVRYYSFNELEKTLLKAIKSKKMKKSLGGLFP